MAERAWRWEIIDSTTSEQDMAKWMASVFSSVPNSFGFMVGFELDGAYMGFFRLPGYTDSVYTYRSH